MGTDLYEVLGVTYSANSEEIKAAYRKLVKQHHPDAGGDKKEILSINAAWEVLGDPVQRHLYDIKKSTGICHIKEARTREVRNARASAAAREAKGKSTAADEALNRWLQQVYIPIDRLLSQIISPCSAEIKALSADPYDDSLMEVFCTYLEKSHKRLKKANQLYRSIHAPITAQGFSLSLYQCFSLVEDAIHELERYTMGYVDNYLHDGLEMLRQAKKRRLNLKEERRQLHLS